MRCKACNTLLIGAEQLLRKHTGEIEDLCLTCLGQVPKDESLDVLMDFDGDEEDE